MRRILLATDSRFWRRRHGTHQRIAELVAVLQQAGVELWVYFVGTLTWDDADALFRSNPGILLQSAGGVPHAHASPDQRWRARRRLWRERLFGAKTSEQAGTTRHLAAFQSPADVRAFRRMRRQCRPNVVLVEFVRLGYLLDALDGMAQRPLTVVDTIDVMHQRSARFAAVGEPHALAISRDEEAAALSRFDAAIAIQATDAASLRSMLPARTVITAGMAPPLHAPAAEPEGPGVVMFVGGASPANVRAARLLLSDVWPLVRKALPSTATLTLVGDVVGAFASDALPGGVSLTGYVPNLDAAYATAHVMVNPVDIGGGLKIKNVEALCHAKPLVTTPLGAEGLEDGAGTAFLVAGSPAEFASHVARLLGDATERRELSRRAHAYALAHFGAARVYGDLLRLINGSEPQPAKA